MLKFGQLSWKHTYKIWNLNIKLNIRKYCGINFWNPDNWDMFQNFIIILCKVLIIFGICAEKNTTLHKVWQCRWALVSESRPRNSIYRVSRFPVDTKYFNGTGSLDFIRSQKIWQKFASIFLCSFCFLIFLDLLVIWFGAAFGIPIKVRKNCL